MFDLLQQRDERPGTFADPGEGITIGQRLADFGSGAARILEAPGDLFSQEGRNLAGAAMDATHYSRLISSRDEAMTEAAQRRIDTVRDATGITLENPFLRGYFQEAKERMAQDGIRGGRRITDYQRRIFEEKVAELRSSHPEKLGIAGLDIPLEGIRNSIATAAEQGLVTAQAGYQAAGRSGIGQLIAEAAGNSVGGYRDPLTLASWIAGPSGAAGNTVMMRMLTEGLTQGFVNLGLVAAEKPFAQAFREERGQPEASKLVTLDEAAHALGFGFLGGAGVRGAIEGASSVFRAGARILKADRSTMEERPPGVTQEAHEAAIDQAAAHVADPENNAPAAIVTALPEAADRTAALQAVVGRAGEETPAVAVPTAITEATERGLPPEYGQVAAEQAPNPADQSPVLDRLAQEHPQTEAEARLIAADEVEGRAEARAVEAEKAEVVKRTRMPKAIREKVDAFLAENPQSGTKALQTRIRREAGRLLTESPELTVEEAFTRAVDQEAELRGSPLERKQATQLVDEYLSRRQARMLEDLSQAAKTRVRKDAVEMLTGGVETEAASAYERAIVNEQSRAAAGKAARKNPVPKQGLYDTNTGHDMMDMVPTQRDDGRSVLIEPEQVKVMGDRHTELADMVKSCKS